ncbi:MAG: bdbD 1 [Rickettsiales bacterium]|jgi:protein-disulfide isomerase|nr:bdbD 1 [Rickettsiales bacterium]
MPTASELKSPIIYIILAVLVVISITNLVSSRGEKLITKADVQEAVVEYVRNNPKEIVAGGLDEYLEQYFKEHSAELSAKLGESATKGMIQGVVTEYIKNNPGEIIASVETWQRGQMEQEQAKAAGSIQEKKSELENDASIPVAGNPKGDVTIVEFFDYNCGYCKRVVPTLAKILEEDKNVKLVLHEFPILSPASEVAAKASIAVYKLDKTKHFQFHKDMMAAGQKTEDVLLEDAAKLGIDKAKMKELMASAEVQKVVDASRELGQSIGVRGTPAFVINGKLIPGAIGEEDFKQLIKEAREKK